jgi:hypothetical protein
MHPIAAIRIPNEEACWRRPKLSQVFNLPRRIFVQQRKRRDHLGHDGRIRRLHTRRNKSEREISCMTGLSRNTVAKWLHGEVDGPPNPGRATPPSAANLCVWASNGIS